MSGDRYEITDDNGLRIDGIPWRERGLLVQYRAIRQLRSDLAAAVAERDTLRAFKQAVEAAPVVAWIWNDELGIAHALPSPKKPVWISSGLSSAMAEIVNLRPLYTAPPAPAAAPKFEAVEVDDAVAKRVERAFGRAVIESENGANGRDMIAAVRAELGAALGLVEMREPTPEECEEISRLWYRFEHSSGQSRGREMVDIVRAVMRPKGGEG